MERKLIALVLIALLGGIGGGGGIGYAISQQQFQNEINSMRTQLDTILSALGVSNGLTNVNVTNFPPRSNVTILNFPQLANVNVTNFPWLSNVYVTNFPDWSLLSNVYVTNFPALMNVNVTNLSFDAQGNLKVNVVGSKPLQEYQESTKITVLDTGSSGTIGSGVYFDMTNRFLFNFNGKGAALNVTDLWVSYVYYSSNGDELFITINDVTAASYIPVPNCGPTAPTRQNTVHVQDVNVYKAIASGINWVELELTPSSSMLLQALDIFIVYEYLA